MKPNARSSIGSAALWAVLNMRRWPMRWRPCRPFSGHARRRCSGRPERPDVLHAALLNGISSHVLDFDDTHAQTTIHPAASTRK